MPVETAATPTSAGPFAACGQLVRQLVESLDSLEQAAALLQLPPLAGREWYEVLRRKLVPQLVRDPYLVVAVVGGTNIGKSVIFNHLAGFRASAVSPLASGTKHPVCLVPAGFESRHDLAEIFADFELVRWDSAEAPLESFDRHKLFWKTAPELPPNLLVLDTPDIDSDAQVNWLRADCIRHSADVLVAVLTQQKYNDAAVKQFFRKAAAEDKAVICVFNQCLMPEDEPYWPRWLETFSQGTGIVPDLVYVAPNDRRAAEELRLPFLKRNWSPENSAPFPPGGGRAVDGGENISDLRSGISDFSQVGPGPGGNGSQNPQSEIGNPQCPTLTASPSPIKGEGGTKNAAAPSVADSPHSLAGDLSDLHFLDIKLRTLRGSLASVLSATSGAPAWLEEMRRRSMAFADAARLLSMQELARIDNWPAAPPRLMVEEIRNWWRSQRHGWTRAIHDAYGTVGQGLLWPFRWARERFGGGPNDPRQAYRRAELDVMLQALDSLYGELQRLGELGNDLLRPRLDRVLAGATRSELLDRLHKQHEALDLDGELRQVVDVQMHAFRHDSPKIFGRLKKFDELAALARPVTSVVLFAAAGPVGHALTPAVTEAATQSVVVHILGDIAGGTGAVVVGETAMSGTAEGLRWLEAWFQKLQTAFTKRRVAWFAEFLRQNVLGNLHLELQTAAAMPDSEAFQDAVVCLDRLGRQLAK